MKLLSVDDARAAMLAEAVVLPSETVPLASAIGRVLAEDIAAVRHQPPFAASAMDGWAMRAADTPGRLRIVGESAAGNAYAGAVAAGEAVRIFTGAAVPAGDPRGGRGRRSAGLYRAEHPRRGQGLRGRRGAAEGGRPDRSLAALPGGCGRPG